jgi:hypothetical protein
LLVESSVNAQADVDRIPTSNIQYVSAEVMFLFVSV